MTSRERRPGGGARPPATARARGRSGAWVGLTSLAVLSCAVLCCAGLTAEGPLARINRLLQAEDLVTRSARSVVSPLSGLRFGRNGDQATGVAEFPAVGRYRFRVTGASTTEAPAGITLFLDDMAAGTVFFSGRHGSTVTFLADVERAGRLPLRWQLTTSVGVSETLLDNFSYERAGDLMAAPRPLAQGSAFLGHDRDLLAMRGLATDEIDAKLDGAFREIFAGGERHALFRRFGSNADGALAVIDEPNFQDIRAEAMGLGLLLTVELDKRPEFDALWNTVHSLMEREPSAALAGSLARALRPDGRIRDPLPSAEAEADVATALLFASGRWGDRAPPYDYATQGRRLVRNMHRASAHGEARPVHGPAPAASLFTERGQPQAFLGEPGTPALTAPRLYTPAFYELWARYAEPGAGRFWEDAVVAARDYLVRTSHPVTGLWPGVTTFEGQPVSGPGDPGAASFRRESWRVLFNLAVDASWWAADPRATDLLDRVHGFFVREGLATYGDAFAQNGRPTSREHAPGLVAMAAAASTASSDPWGWRFVDELWALPFGLGRRPTSDSLLQLLGLLHVAGRFRVWVPAPPPHP